MIVAVYLSKGTALRVAQIVVTLLHKSIMTFYLLPSACKNLYHTVFHCFKCQNIDQEAKSVNLQRVRVNLEVLDVTCVILLE